MSSSSDPFGLLREEKIVKSKVREVFTPHTPIRSVDLFFGRQQEVQRIIEQINTPGQHCLLYGDRGVGKTSLANIATQTLIQHLVEGRLYTKRCDSCDSFETIVAEPLRYAGVEVNAFEKCSRSEVGGKAALNLGPMSLGGNGKSASETKEHLPQLSPSYVAEQLKSFLGVLYIDEVDSLRDNMDRQKIAELIKQLSDNGSPFKVLVVGIAETAEQLTAAHPSVHRCLKENKLRRMPREELALIVTNGAIKLNLSFDSAVVNAIARLSSGYPHFTHLLALKCAEEAVAHDKVSIKLPDLTTAMNLAVADAEATLRRKYNDATRSYATPMYTKILLAAAKTNAEEFSAGQLRTSVFNLTGEELAQNSLNNYLRRLVSDSVNTILVRKSKGVYKFADPRMPSFIRIANSDLDDQTRAEMVITVHAITPPPS